MSYFGIHNHTHYSNIRLLDSINTPKTLIDRAIEQGMTGIAITDHEALCGHVEVNQIAKKIRETNSDFKIALGNEIYLTETRDKGQKYFHFILIAKDALGHKALRTLSSQAWINSYQDRSERVPTLKSELAKVMIECKGHVIGTTACFGGELSQMTWELVQAERQKQPTDTINSIKSKIVQFILSMKDIFGEDDFYIEIAPSLVEEQQAVNKRLSEIARGTNCKIVFGTDSHYLSQEDRIVHKTYLNSKDGDREVDDFYAFSYLMKDTEVKDYLTDNLFSLEEIQTMINNTNEIAKKIEFYDLAKEQVIPLVAVKDFPIITTYTGYEFIDKMLRSKEIQDRYWINSCLNKLKEIKLYNDVYLDRLNTEADVVDFISHRLNQPLTAYFNTLQSYINIFWECGSILGPGRGSAVGLT